MLRDNMNTGYRLRPPFRCEKGGFYLLVCSNNIENYTVWAIINGQQELSLDNCLHRQRQIFVIPFLYIGILNCDPCFHSGNCARNNLTFTVLGTIHSLNRRGCVCLCILCAYCCFDTLNSSTCLSMDLDIHSRIFASHFVTFLW